MAKKLSRIRTPLSQQFRRIRYQLIPVLAFGGSLILALRLWERHAGTPMAVGEIEALQFQMTAPVAGILAEVPGKAWHRFDKVAQGDVVARLDDRIAEAALATVRKELGQLKAELAATEARTYQELAAATRDFANQERRRRAELRQVAIDVEQLRLDILDRKALIETDRIELRRLEEQYAASRKAYEQKAETSYTLTDIQLLRDTVKRRVESNEKALAEAEEQMRTMAARKQAAAEALQKLSASAMSPSSDVGVFLGPVEAAIDTQEARVTELELQAQSLAIRAPVSGTILEIYRRPGQPVQPGELIMTLAIDQSQHVISYLREQHAVRPTKGMRVSVRTRSMPRKTVKGQVEQVGPQVAEVPPHHLRDPNVPEWGLPVRIAVPDLSALPPGELVDVSFEPTP